MEPNPLKLILTGYAGAAALAWLATGTAGAGWTVFIATLWLCGPLVVLGLATLPPFAAAFANRGEEDGAVAAPAAAPRCQIVADIAAWDADAAAEREATLATLAPRVVVMGSRRA